MRIFPRTLSSAGSFGANAILLLAISASVANLPQLRLANPALVPPGHPGWYEPLDLWGPFIEHPAAIGASRPSCPAPLAHPGDVLLVHAPLPRGFDTASDSSGPSHVCVRLDRWAQVRDVRVPGGRAPGLTDAVRRQWRFQLNRAGGAEPGWHRVRVKRSGSHEL